MPKKRSNGEGSIHKRPNGLWEWQIMVGYHPDGRRKTKSFYARTQKEVKEKGTRFLEQMASQPKLNGEMLFRDWADMWYESMKGQVSDTTYEGYQFTLKLLKDYFGEMRLASIKAIHVEEFLRNMLSEGKSHSYMTKFRGMLFQIMKKAEANDLIYRNPVAVADKIKAPDKLSMKDAFTAEEIAILMKELPDDRLGWSIRLLLGSGMRSQELLALEPKHIEEDGSCIHIRQAVTMVKGTPKIGPPKTKNSYRDIPVPEKLRPCAVKLRQTDQPYIWHGVKSPICNPSVFRKHYADALRAIPGVRPLSPHCCRHTYVSQLQAKGVDIETIKNLSGHADIDMTQHYLHVQREIKERAADRLNQVF